MKAVNMDTDIHERLAVVETRLGVVVKQQGEMADDLRIIRDHVLAEKGARRALFIIGGFLTGSAGVWSAFGDRIVKFFS